MTRKAFLPGTYVLGSSPVMDMDPVSHRRYQVHAVETMKQPGHGDVPYAKRNEPVWRKPKPSGADPTKPAFEQHFKNEAARRSAYGRAEAHALAEAEKSGADMSMVTLEITREMTLRFAQPKELKLVPQYRGIGARVANVIRASKVREAREERARREQMSMTEKALESLGLAKEDYGVSA